MILPVFNYSLTQWNGIAATWVKGQTRYQIIQELPSVETETLLGQSFLVSRLFCQHRWSE
jgi:hypothetical protein